MALINKTPLDRQQAAESSKIIVVTGFSGAGKSTLIRGISEDSGAKIVDISSIMKESALKQNFSRVLFLLMRQGIPKATADIAPKLISHIGESFPKSGIIIDELCYYKLFQQVEAEFGRDNMTVISLQANLADRMKRYTSRGTPLPRMPISETVKFLGGTLKIMSEADIIINEPSAELARMAYRSHFGQMVSNP